MKLHSEIFLPDSLSNAANKILFLHGLGGTGRLWRSIIYALEKKFFLLTLDQRGHGQSLKSPDDPSGYAPLDFGQDVIDTLSTPVHEIDFRPTWMVGHSMGVRTACAAASLKPQWCSGLILIDLGLSGGAGGGLNENLTRFLKILPPGFSTREQARNFMHEHSPDASIAQYLMAVLSLESNGCVHFPFNHSALIQTLQDAQGSDLKPWIHLLAKLKKPILLLRGEKSKVWSRENFEEERKLFAPYQNIIFQEVEGAGHGLPFEKREIFVPLLSRFVETHSTPTNA